MKKKKRRFPKLCPSSGDLFRHDRHSRRGTRVCRAAISNCRRNTADSRDYVYRNIIRRATCFAIAGETGVAICGTRRKEPGSEFIWMQEAVRQHDFRVVQSRVDKYRSSICYAADFLPLTINASAGKLIVPLAKYLRAASATACFTVGS